MSDLHNLDPRTLPETADLVYRLDTDAVALTFDDCGVPSAWGRILDVLATKGVTCTFFPTGLRAQECPELALRTVQEGHGIGSHGWDHLRFTELEDDGKEARLRADRDWWIALAGTNPQPYFRPPYGSYDDATRIVAARCGYPKMALWDVDPKDRMCDDADEILDNVISRSKPGSIVVLHVIERTADVLPRLLDELSARGLSTVALPR